MGGKGSREYDPERLVREISGLEKALDGYAGEQAKQGVVDAAALHGADLREALLQEPIPAPIRHPSLPEGHPNAPDQATKPASALRRQSLKNAEKAAREAERRASLPRDAAAETRHAVAAAPAPHEDDLCSENTESLNSCLAKKPNPHPPAERRNSDHTAGLHKIGSVRMAGASGNQAPAGGTGSTSEKKKAIATLKQRRGVFLGNVAWKHPEPPPSGDVKCAALGCVAVAVSQCLSTSDPPRVDISLEDVFYALQLPLHYITLSSLTMAELYDFTTQFLAVGANVKQGDYEVVCVTFEDLHTADSDEESADEGGEDESDAPTGESVISHERAMSLMEFQKELSQQFLLSPCAYILNYDPYVVQEARIAVLMDEEEEDVEEDGNRFSPSTQAAAQAKRRASQLRRMDKLRKVKKRNQGAFAVLTGYNAALSEVQIASVHVTDEGLRVTTEPCPLSTVFDACRSRDGYTKRPRGFVKIQARRHPTVPEPAPRRETPPEDRLFYSRGEIEASDGYGVPLDRVDPAIRGALVAGGYAVHLYNTRNTGEESGVARGIPSSSQGVAVSDVFRELGLPLDVVVQSEGGVATPLEEAFTLLRAYLSHHGRLEEVYLGVMPISRKQGADDGAVNFSESDLRHQVHEVHEAAGSSVMVVNFDAMKAHARHTREPALSHFGAVVGYNASTQTVSVADVSPKTFKKVWRLPLSRLWEAMIGFGFIVMRPSDGNAPRHKFEPKMTAHGQALMRLGMHKMPPKGVFSAFSFPQKPYCVTAMAMALTAVRGMVTTVEEVIRCAGFPLSFLLSDHLSFGDFVRVFQAVVRDKFGSSVAIEARYADIDMTDQSGLAAAIESCANAEGEEMLVHFSASQFAEEAQYYPGVGGGSYALLQGYNAEEGLVTLMTAAPQSSRRMFHIPIGVLYSLMRVVDFVSGRSRGVIRVSPGAFSDVPLQLSVTPIPHPFKCAISPQVAGVAFAFSSLGRKVYPEEVFYDYLATSRQDSGPAVLLKDISTSLTLDVTCGIITSCSQRLGVRVVPSVMPLKGCADAAALSALLIQAHAEESSVLLVTSDVAVGLGFNSSLSTTSCGIIASACDKGVVVVEANPTKVCSPRQSQGWGVP